MDSASRRWWTLFAMAGALTMIMIDGTGVSIALPAIQRGLDLNHGALQWVITVYSLTLASMLALGGRFGDLFGRPIVFVCGVVLFAAGSLVCALAPNLPVLVVGRVVEGLANVLMMPAAAVLVTEVFDAKERGRAMGLYTAIGSSFQAVGPLIGGALVQFVSWRAVFLINLPVAALVLILAAIARPHAPRVPGPPLKVGPILLLVGGLTSLVLDSQQSHAWGWTSPWTLGLLGGGLAALALFVPTQLRAAEPLLDVALFGKRGFTADVIVLFCAQFALIGQAAFNAIYLQRILHFSPVQAGLALLLFLFPWMLMAPVGGLLFDRYGAKLPASLGLTLITLGFFLETQTFPMREFVWVAPAMVLIGLGLVLALPQAYTDGITQVSAERRGQAFGMLDTMRQLGAALGMASIGTLVATFELARLGPIASSLASTPAEQADLKELLLQATRGQTEAGRTLVEHWPGAIEELRSSGAQSIANGYYLGTAVTALGLVLVLWLMRWRPRAAADLAKPGAPAG